MWTWIAACLGGLAVTLLGEKRTAVPLMLAGKAVAASAYLAAGIALGGLQTPYGRWMLVGMACCWLGDLLLVVQSNRRVFLAGLAAFLAGHLAYSGAFLGRGQAVAALAPAAVLMSLFGWAVWRWLRASLEPRMRLPVLLYLLALSSMMCLGVGTWAARSGLEIVAGAALFVLSDLAVARNRFVAPGFVNRAWGLPAYFAGQMLLAASLAV